MMPESVKRIYGSNPIEYHWPKGHPLVFITHWGEKGDTLWVSPTYNSGVLERSRGRWGLTNNGAQNPSNWMDRINFHQYNDSIHAVTNPIGIKQIEEIECEIAQIEEELAVLHARLQQAKQKKIQTYRAVCKEFSMPITSKDLVSMRDCAHEAGEDMVACCKTSQEVLDNS
jgi:hypothetical protein